MNKIVIELSEEDRARLDRIADALEKAEVATLNINMAKGVHNSTRKPIPTTPEEATKEEPQEKTNPVEENGPKATTENTDATTPNITLEHIQQKVVELCAGNGGAKKAKVRATINAYGAKVSDLKEQPDKWAEVWEKLIDLESEG